LSSHRRAKLIQRTIDYTEIPAIAIPLNVLSHRERMMLSDAWDRRETEDTIAECLKIATVGMDVEQLVDTLTTRECYEVIAAAFNAATLTDEERKKSLSSPTGFTEKSAEVVGGDIVS